MLTLHQKLEATFKDLLQNDIIRELPKDRDYNQVFKALRDNLPDDQKDLVMELDEELGRIHSDFIDTYFKKGFQTGMSDTGVIVDGCVSETQETITFKNLLETIDGFLPEEQKDLIGKYVDYVKYENTIFIKGCLEAGFKWGRQCKEGFYLDLYGIKLQIVSGVEQTRVNTTTEIH